MIDFRLEEISHRNGPIGEHLQTLRSEEGVKGAGGDERKNHRIAEDDSPARIIW